MGQVTFTNSCLLKDIFIDDDWRLVFFKLVLRFNFSGGAHELVFDNVQTLHDLFGECRCFLFCLLVKYLLSNVSLFKSLPVLEQVSAGLLLPAGVL